MPEEKKIENLQNKAGVKVIEIGGTIVLVVVSAAVAIAVIGGNLIEFVQALL